MFCYRGYVVYKFSIRLILSLNAFCVSFHQSFSGFQASMSALLENDLKSISRRSIYAHDDYVDDGSFSDEIEGIILLSNIPDLLK